VRAHRHELDIQKDKFAQLETKFQEQDQKHDKETPIILKELNKKAHQILMLQQENREFRQALVQQTAIHQSLASSHDSMAMQEVEQELQPRPKQLVEAKKV